MNVLIVLASLGVWYLLYAWFGWFPFLLILLVACFLEW